MNWFVRTIERLTGSVGVFAALLIVPLILATSYEVLSRYAFNAPTVWAYEIGYMLTGSHFLLAMAFALREGQHIRIDVFSGKFSPRTRAIVDLALFSVLLPLTVWLTLALVRHMYIAYETDEHSGQSALNLPVWPFRLVFSIAFALLVLQVAAEMMKLAQQLRAGRARGRGADDSGAA
ncbi:MAG: TRAP transporter small permease subunit [Burkholderiales bacterium]|nr:TRAP transporter small permease subunit [Burkholderiales bacterium]